MKRRTVELTAEQREELVRARARERRPYLRECAAALLQIADGRSAHAVALGGRHKRRAPETVAGWLTK